MARQDDVSYNYFGMAVWSRLTEPTGPLQRRFKHRGDKVYELIKTTQTNLIFISAPMIHTRGTSVLHKPVHLRNLIYQSLYCTFSLFTAYQLRRSRPVE
jgi:hypothetical protein